MSCAVTLVHVYFFSLLCARAARARFTIESNVFDPNASGFSIAESNASDMVMASNCESVAIFLPSGKLPNFCSELRFCVGNSRGAYLWACSNHHHYFTVVFNLHLAGETQ